MAQNPTSKPPLRFVYSCDAVGLPAQHLTPALACCFFGIPLQEAIEALAGEVKRGKAPGVRDAQARSGRLVIFHTRDSR